MKREEQGVDNVFKESLDSHVYNVCTVGIEAPKKGVS